MRKQCLETVYKLAKKNKDIIFIGSDLGHKTLENFKEELPEQFIMEGISEGHIVGMAAGLAMSGKTVYVNTIATFLTRRAFEQNTIDLGLTNANVRLLGNGGGLVYAPLGSTHMAFEDIAIMRTIPNMTICVPADENEMIKIMQASELHQGPMYIRIAKGNEPIVTDPSLDFEIGKAQIYSEGEVLLITNGVMLKRALEVKDTLSSSNISVGVINVPTVKPFDYKTILPQIKKSKLVATIEEHSTIGGLGSIVGELIAENCFDHQVKFKKFALPDEFPDYYGSQNEILAHYGLETPQLVDSIKSLYN